ncbi:predicted protein [Naegleria gruberi]|uniref:Predicted protein n=1 Tax=Naegleria gruberi TaxID=5762 RepID=D2VQ27_NAEGR|nr:uncharacterized protein NAEGRDRAFT_71140 [Naegleria gruberi]EFC41108.1 predicted protein [Naegleria gruberi]|eukprot:XP_002673852.1 predicted protein [Naegleria gruberi strain NEG-M]
MDVLVKNNVNFAYPLKVLVFPFLALGILKATQLPKLQSTVFCCGRLTGDFKKVPLYTCSQCLVEVKYANAPKKLNLIERVTKSNPFLGIFTDNEVRLACRTPVDDDMYVITYCDDAPSKKYILFIIGLVAVYIGYYLVLYMYASTIGTENNQVELSDEAKELLKHLSEKDLEEWVKSKSEVKTGSMKAAEDEIVTIKITDISKTEK